MCVKVYRCVGVCRCTYNIVGHLIDGMLRHLSCEFQSDDIKFNFLEGER